MSENLKKANAKRGSYKRQITLFAEYVNTYRDDDLSQLQERYERIPQVWEDFQEISIEIECLLQEKEDQTLIDDLIENGQTYEKTYFEALGMARNILKKLGPSATIQSKQEQSNVQETKTNNVVKVNLPPLIIQPFSGSYDKWLSFKDAFLTAVHNENHIPKIQKFQILRGLLRDDALRLISALEATDINYAIAWELLEKRYENSRIIINTHMRALFDLPTIQKLNHTSLRRMVDDVRIHCRSLASLKQPVDHWDTVMIYLVNQKLDNLTREEWEHEVSKEHKAGMPSLEDLLEFLEKRCITLEMTEKVRFKHDVTLSTQPKKVSLAIVSSASCYLCNGSHLLYKCERFLSLPQKSRCNEVKKLHLCINCLKPGHSNQECKSSFCRKCKSRHNTLLHNDDFVTNQKIHNDQKAGDTQQSHIDTVQRVVTHCMPRQANTRATHVILSTVQVYIEDADGKLQKCRALLDPGSQSNILTEEFARKLRIPFDSVNIPLSGVNKSRSLIRKTAIINLTSTTSRYSTQLECLILPNITENLPQRYLNLQQLHIPDKIELADSEFNVPGPINLLLNAGIFWAVLRHGEYISNKNQPVLQNTHLGWIVGGDWLIRDNQSPVSTCHLVTTLENQMEKFWEIEELNIKQKQNEDQDYAETHFQRTHSRDAEGRFQVELPMRSDIKLGNSFDIAFRRLVYMENRLNKQVKIKEEYHKFLSDYETSGHMSQSNAKGDEEHYYIPHHPVVRVSSLTTKLRVVFDASAKSSTGASLNDKLLIGPNLQNELFHILLRFRCYEYVLTADVEQMFRQIQVKDKDRHLQRILWRENPDQPLKIYTLNTVTYGTACAPFLAIRCMRQLAEDGKDDYPLAAQAIKEDCYMDDVLTGTNSLLEAIELQCQLSKLCESGKFHLRKWRANDNKILQRIANQSKVEDLLIIDSNDSIKTLGLLWNSKSDLLQFSINISVDSKVSKRKILSTISQIYDPLGIIGPLIITAKIIIQELWKLHINWDDAVPQDLETNWTNFWNSLQVVKKLNITRNVSPRNISNKIILHGFSDASEKAYGACLYILSKNEDGEVQSNLICSKSRVALLKPISLPRLELNASLILARLISLVQRVLKQEITEVHCWSDSTITLYWIRTPPSNLKTYVANRVAEIQELTCKYSWHHIPTKHNPADYLSRGISPDKLLTLDSWWYGPDWLITGEWPSQVIPSLEEIPEYKTVVTLTTMPIEIDLLKKFSSFNKLQRVVAYCYRVYDKAKKAMKPGPLSVEELERAHTKIIKWIQEEVFFQEIKSLRSGKPISTRSPLLPLKLFLDNDGLIKVGGRLQNADIPVEQKHPILLPARNHITEIIIRAEHIRLLHCGPQQLLCSIRLKYWPLSGGREVRKVIRRCIPCFRYRPKVPEVIMADLPESRVTTSVHPFETVGIDFAGPFQVRESRRRGRIPTTKGYVAVFVCFSTKAVHLEMVSDLTVESFLAALRRFVARRGLCKVIYTDNATNFVGASRELENIFDFLSNYKNELSTRFASQRITWNFIPPRSPHFGGLWESAVKSAKKHLYTVAKGLLHTFEKYSTLLSEIESVLNSRPLTQLSSNPNDFSALTPSHFLIGTALQQPVSKSFVDVSDNCLSRWQHLQKLKQHFWQRWKREYLHQLQTRTKWISGSEILKTGALVLMIEDNTAPLHWPLARVTETFPGSDGFVRVVNVKTSTGVYRRSVKKLCALPLDI